jgi:hypothetical protein
MSDPTWEVPLYVDGPVTVNRRINMTRQKGFRQDDPFWSEIEIMPTSSGIRAKVTARAPNRKLAFDAAVFFYGRMLDVLSLEIDESMYLRLAERQDSSNGRSREDIRRRIEVREIENAFEEVRHLAINSPSFLRGLGWYRKGNYTEDPFDKFLAFWNAIEIVASKYFRYIPTIDLSRAKGSKGQIWECFKALWGPCENWPIIASDTQWIDESNATRVEIAHGTASVDISKVGEVSAGISRIRQVAHRFLRDSRDGLLNLDRNPPKEVVPIGADVPHRECKLSGLTSAPHTPDARSPAR